jgi:hypothetical protein
MVEGARNMVMHEKKTWMTQKLSFVPDELSKHHSI